MPATPDFTHLTRPLTAGNLDDGYWNIELPWPIYFLSISAFGNPGSPDIHVTTNGIVGSGLGVLASTVYNITASAPATNKLVIAGADNVISSFTYKVTGTAPNRKACIRYEGFQYGSNFTVSPIVWEVLFSEQLSFRSTFISVNVIENSRWGFTGPISGLYGLYTANGTLVENPTNFGKPGLAWYFELWYAPGLYNNRASAKPVLPNQHFTTNRVLFISANENFTSGSTGVMMIANPGMPADVLAYPLNYVKDLYFHSSLPYLQITGIRTPTWTLYFPAVNRDIVYWEDPGSGGHGGGFC